jgi:hypothetical protein
MADYCTLAEVKALLGTTEDEDDGLLAALISRASAWIERFTGRRFAGQAETRSYASGETWLSSLWLDQDLLSVTSLTNTDGDEIAAAGYVLLPLNGLPKNRIELKSGYSWGSDPEGLISVAGTWGFAAAPPADITQAACRLTVWLYKQRDAPFGKVGNSLTGEYETPVALPKDVEALLKPYRRVIIGGW